MPVRTLQLPDGKTRETRLLGDVIDRTRGEDSDHYRIEEQNKIRVEIGQTQFTRAEDVPLDMEHWLNYERVVKDEGITVSQMLERLNPTTTENRGQGRTDAFTRQMKRFGFRTKADNINGIPASYMEDMYMFPPERDSR